MKSKYLILSALLIVCFGGLSLFAAEATKTGILIDAMCGEMNAKNVEAAAGHKVACSLMPNCKASGFGIVAEGKFYKFDESGDQEAVKISENTKKIENLKVKVTGEFAEDSVKVNKIEEAE